MSPCRSVSLFLFFFLTSVHATSADGGNINIICEACKKCTREDPNVSFKFCVASPKSNTNSRRTGPLGAGPRLHQAVAA
ncbi:hypothetical protein NL676_012013 [Syzygium grande]|nr:hypothetical protein NL676_012013 [Syzygium grande]